jgi:hypothetical protein
VRRQKRLGKAEIHVVAREIHSLNHARERHLDKDAVYHGLGADVDGDNDKPVERVARLVDDGARLKRRIPGEVMREVRERHATRAPKRRATPAASPGPR